MDLSQIGGYVALAVSVGTAYTTWQSKRDENRLNRAKLDVDSGKTKVDADAQFRDDLMVEVTSLRADIKALQTANGELVRQNGQLEGRVERQNGQIEQLTQQLQAQAEVNGQLRSQLTAEVEARTKRDSRIQELETQLTAEIQTRQGCDQRITELQAQVDKLSEGSAS